RCTDFLIPIEIPVQNAAAGIYEMASKVNGSLTELTDSLTDRIFKITRFYRGPNGLTAKNKYIPPLAAPKPAGEGGLPRRSLPLPPPGLHCLCLNPIAPVRRSAAGAIPSPR